MYARKVQVFHAINVRWLRCGYIWNNDMYSSQPAQFTTAHSSTCWQLSMQNTKTAALFGTACWLPICLPHMTTSISFDLQSSHHVLSQPWSYKYLYHCVNQQQTSPPPRTCPQLCRTEKKIMGHVLISVQAPTSMQCWVKESSIQWLFCH